MSMTSLLRNFDNSISGNENFETTTVVWLDDHLFNSKKHEIDPEKLRSAINQIKTFTKSEECRKYVEHLFHDDRIVLITTGRLGKDLIPLIYHCRQIISIYIFCMDPKRHETWTQQYTKIKGVYADFDSLVENLAHDQEKRTHTKVDEPLSINIFTTRTNTDQSTTTLNFKFIYHNLFLDSLLRMKPTSKDKDELMIRCYELYKNNPSELAVIREFDEKYTPDDALGWYTRETFIYRLLNKGLRTQNLDLLFFFRFFLSDLQKQIEDNQCQQRMQIYRAQLMSIDELNELKNSIGEYISINSFFSTSRDKDYALFLLGDLSSVYEDFQKILFQIDADPTHVGVKSFADISSKSYFKNECEILIMLGAIFRLEEIYLNEQNIWIIDLTLTSCDDCHLKNPIDHDKQINLFTFGQLLHQMNKFDEAEKYYRRLLKEFSNDSNQTSLCYYHIGRVYSGRGKSKDAIRWYEKSLKTMIECTDIDKSNIADCYNSIANIHRRQDNYRLALQFYEKALKIWKDEYGDDHLKIAMCLINMGVIYDFEEKYCQALQCLEKALQIKEKNYQGNNHADIAILYNNIGLVHQHSHHFNLALENFQQAYDIYQILSLEQNREYAITLENIGYLFEQMENWRSALTYLEEAANIYRQFLSSEHPKVIEIEQTIQHISFSANKNTSSEQTYETVF